MAQGHKKRGSGRRTFWLITVLFGLLIGAVSIGSYYFIRDASAVMTRDLEHDLRSRAQSKTAAITVWFGGLKNNMQHFADNDMFRLFAAETHRLHAIEGEDHSPKSTEAPTQSLSETPEGEDATMGPPLPPPPPDHQRLRDSRPLMNQQLRLFSRNFGLLGARFLEHNMETLLSTDSTLPDLTPEQERAARKAISNGSLVVLPVKSTNDGMVMDVVQPIFPPAYLDLPVNKAVGALFLHIPVSAALSRFFEEASQHQAMRLLQDSQQDGPLEEILPSTSELESLPGWFVVGGEALPLARRLLPDGKGVYSLAEPVPDLPWLVSWEIEAQVAEAAYVGSRNTVLLGAGAALTTGALLLCVVWWFIVGRSERAFAAEIRDLYEEVNNQKQLLDGINTALADGIVMTDKQGRIKFSNTAFARLAGHSPSALVGLEAAALLSPESAQRMAAHRAHVLSSAKGRIYNDTLLLRGHKRFFQIACSPYRNQDGEVTGTVSVYRDTTQVMEAQERSHRMVRQTINVLMRAIEAVDPYLCGHSAHTGFLAASLAQRLNLSPADRDTVRTAATLSQIGMLRLPPELLRKSGILTHEERKLMEKHVEYACNLLAGFDFGLPVQDTIGQMHECLDGSGYPVGLVDKQIGLHARILAIANAFCAMVRPRSYRQAKDVQEALHILDARPPKYDPAIVQSLRNFLHSEKGAAFLMDLQGTNSLNQSEQT